MKIKLLSHLLIISTAVTPNAISFNQQVFLEFYTNNAKADQWGNNYFQAWKKAGLTASEENAYRFYTSVDGPLINTYLRTTKGFVLHPSQTSLYQQVEAKIKEKNNSISVNYLTQTIKQMIASTKRIAVPDNLIVYRWTNEDNFGLPKNSLRNQFQRINQNNFYALKNSFTGMYQRQDSFVSTSLVSKIPLFDSSKYPIRLKIKVTKGARALYLAPLSKFPQERELLIRSKQKLFYDSFRIVNEINREYISVDANLINYA